MLMQREAALREAQNEAKVRRLEIERLKLQLAKARHETYGLNRNRASFSSSSSNWRSAFPVGRRRRQDLGAGLLLGLRLFQTVALAARPAQAARQSAGRGIVDSAL